MSRLPQSKQPKKAEPRPEDKILERLETIRKRLLQAYSMGMSDQVIAQLQMMEAQAQEEYRYYTEIARARAEEKKESGNDGIV